MVERTRPKGKDEKDRVKDGKTTNKELKRLHLGAFPAQPIVDSTIPQNELSFESLSYQDNFPLSQRKKEMFWDVDVSQWSIWLGSERDSSGLASDTTRQPCESSEPAEIVANSERLLNQASDSRRLKAVNDHHKKSNLNAVPTSHSLAQDRKDEDAAEIFSLLSNLEINSDSFTMPQHTREKHSLHLSQQEEWSCSLRSSPTTLCSRSETYMEDGSLDTSKALLSPVQPTSRSSTLAKKAKAYMPGRRHVAFLAHDGDSGEIAGAARRISVPSSVDSPVSSMTPSSSRPQDRSISFSSNLSPSQTGPVSALLYSPAPSPKTVDLFSALQSPIHRHRRNSSFIEVNLEFNSPRSTQADEMESNPLRHSNRLKKGMEHPFGSSHEKSREGNAHSAGLMGMRCPDPFKNYRQPVKRRLEAVYRWMKAKDDVSAEGGIVLSLEHHQIVAIVAKLLLTETQEMGQRETSQSDESPCGGTLIVSRSKQDVDAWEQALRHGTPHSVLDYSTLTRFQRARPDNAVALASFDVVLSTYDEIIAKEITVSLDEKGHVVSKVGFDDGWYSSRSGLQDCPISCQRLASLHLVNWRRVIFADVLQKKSYLAKFGTLRARACVALNADAR